MLSIWGSSPEKSLKLNITATTNLNYPSFASKITQKLDNYNPKLQLSLQPMTSPSNENKRLNSLSFESSQPVKKRKIEGPNINMLTKYGEPQDQNSIKEYGIEIKQEPISTSPPHTPKIQRFNQESLERNSNQVKKSRSMSMEVKNCLKAKRFYNIPPRVEDSNFNNFSNLKQTKIEFKSKIEDISKSFKFNNPQEVHEPQISAIYLYQQLLKFELALFGAGTDYLSSFFQPFQTPNLIKEEPESLSRYETKSPPNLRPSHYKFNSSIFYEKKSNEDIVVKQEECSNPSNTTTYLILGQGFTSFQNPKIAESISKFNSDQGFKVTEIRPSDQNCVSALSLSPNFQIKLFRNGVSINQKRVSNGQNKPAQQELINGSNKQIIHEKIEDLGAINNSGIENGTKPLLESKNKNDNLVEKSEY